MYTKTYYLLLFLFLSYKSVQNVLLGWINLSLTFVTFVNAWIVWIINSFSAKGNIQVFANNTDSGESARNELSHLKSALFAI